MESTKKTISSTWRSVRRKELQILPSSWSLWSRSTMSCSKKKGRPPNWNGLGRRRVRRRATRRRKKRKTIRKKRRMGKKVIAMRRRKRKKRRRRKKRKRKTKKRRTKRKRKKMINSQSCLTIIRR
jgi:hypothetical protein